MTSAWYVYMIRTDRNQLYTGITTDPVRRYREHATGIGARFFRSSKPVAMVFCRPVADRAAASSLEMKIKRMNRAQKNRLVAEEPNVPEKICEGLIALGALQQKQAGLSDDEPSVTV